MHIISRVAMIYDQTGSVSPLAGYGNYITRLALIETKGDVTMAVSDDTREKCLDFLYFIQQFGKLSFKPNLGKQVTLERPHSLPILMQDEILHIYSFT